TRGLQRKPHALFPGSQGLNRLIPFGDVGTGAERADDLPRVIPQHRVAPFDEPFVTRLGENRVLDDRQIAADQAVEGVSEYVPHPEWKARLDPILAKQL